MQSLITNRRSLGNGLVWLFLAASPVYAQQLQPVSSVQADCGKFVNPPITTAGTFNSQNIDNRFAGCDGFVVTYSSNGFATVSVLLQDAPLGVGGIAGTFVSFAGTIVTGFTNPTTATTQGETRATGYFPYVRVSITTTGTGYLVAEVHGFKTNPNSGSGAAAGGCAGTSATPCVVDGPTAAGNPATKPPVLIAGQDATNIRTLSVNPAGAMIPSGVLFTFNDGLGSTVNTPQIETSAGTVVVSTAIFYPYNFTGQGLNSDQWDRQFVCANQTPVITLSDATRTLLVAASGSTSIRICHVHFTTSGAAEEFTISSGTGATCAGGTAVIDDFLGVTAVAMDYQPTASLRGGASNAVCVTQSGAAQTAKITAVYAQF